MRQITALIQLAARGKHVNVMKKINKWLLAALPNLIIIQNTE